MTTAMAGGAGGADALRRVRLTLAYDGTDFAGSQRQASGRTVQGELERAAGELHGEPVSVLLAGRTDSGTHALGMVAAYTVRTRLGPQVLARALNARLGPDMRVLGCEWAAPEFHPRFDARSKLYRYRLWVAEHSHPLVRRTAWHVRGPLDASAMREALGALVGERDFGAFRSSGSEVRTSVRRLLRARLGRRGRLWTFELEGSGFLRHQVRAMVGTLLEVGRGRLQLEGFRAIVEAARREAAGPTAPAHGLVLVRVLY
jgi:tRNA pseudouridine38-40 synthase